MAGQAAGIVMLCDAVKDELVACWSREWTLLQRTAFIYVGILAVRCLHCLAVIIASPPATDA